MTTNKDTTLLNVQLLTNIYTNDYNKFDQNNK